MKSTSLSLGVATLSLYVVAFPVWAVASGTGDIVAERSTASNVADDALGEVEGASDPSTATLAGAAGAFLLLGMGTTVIAHRRRWRVIDLRDGTQSLADDPLDRQNA